jgi:magnesium chelatase family protein
MQRYLSKISGPLLDRIDIHIEVTPVPSKNYLMIVRRSSVDILRKRVTAAREIQSARFEEMNNIHYNAQMNTKHIREYCALDETSNYYKNKAMERLNLSARAYDRILKVARTIADLDAAPKVVFSSHCRGVYNIVADIEMVGWGRNKLWLLPTDIDGF